MGWSSGCKSVGVLGLFCIQGSVGCCLVYPGLHLHTPVLLLPLFCALHASFGSGHGRLNEVNEHEFSEIQFDLKLANRILKTELYT